MKIGLLRQLLLDFPDNYEVWIINFPGPDAMINVEIRDYNNRFVCTLQDLLIRMREG